MSAAARSMSASATGESVEKIGIAASSSGVSMPIRPRRPDRKLRARCVGAFAALSSRAPISDWTGGAGAALRLHAQRGRMIRLLDKRRLPSVQIEHPGLPDEIVAERVMRLFADE